MIPQKVNGFGDIEVLDELVSAKPNEDRKIERYLQKLLDEKKIKSWYKTDAYYITVGSIVYRYTLDTPALIVVDRIEKIISDYEIQNKSDINHPERYNGGSDYECYKVLREWMTPEEYRGFLRGNALKYLCRLGKKDEAVKELQKAQWYISQLIEELQK